MSIILNHHWHFGRRKHMEGGPFKLKLTPWFSFFFGWIKLTKCTFQSSFLWIFLMMTFWVNCRPSLVSHIPGLNNNMEWWGTLLHSENKVAFLIDLLALNLKMDHSITYYSPSYIVFYLVFKEGTVKRSTNITLYVELKR